MIKQAKKFIRGTRRKIRNLFGNEYYKDTPWTDAEIRRLIAAAHEVGGSRIYQSIELKRQGYDEDLGYPLHVYNVSNGVMKDILKKAGIERGHRR